jgi:hypothetical protein
MKSTILFNVSGTSTTDNGTVIASTEISVKVTYDPILLLNELGDNLPKVMQAFDKLVKAFESATSNDNDAPPASTENGSTEFNLRPPFEAAHASSDDLDVELTADDDGNVNVTPKS